MKRAARARQGGRARGGPTGAAGSLEIVILGLSITSSWGNGHATTYRGLVRELAARGHRVLFLERDAPWYAEHRDLVQPAHSRVVLYSSLEELIDRFTGAVRDADLVIVGSYVADGVRVGRWVTQIARGLSAFYDIDTPVTLRRLDVGDSDAGDGAEANQSLEGGNSLYLTRDLIQRYDLYLSFTGGPTLQRLERELGSPMARPLYCSADPLVYAPEERAVSYDLGYMGTYSDDRQPGLESLLLEPARRSPEARFVVAGPLYPEELRWPPNVTRVEHVGPAEHRAFYAAQRFTLNVTRAEMVRVGHSPSVRLFEAAACGTPVISDAWAGLEEFFTPGREILISRSPEETIGHLRLDDAARRRLGARARARVLAEHTAAHRAWELERHALAALEQRALARRYQGVAR